jgi:hypothetical protein
MLAVAMAPMASRAQEGAVVSDAARAHFLEADLVFVAKVVRLGKPPPAGSGFVLERQAVVYEVERVLAGRWSPRTVAVHHVVAGGPLGHPERGRPELNPDVFRPGRRLLVAATFAEAAEFGPAHFPYLLVDDNEQVGVLEADVRSVAAIEATLAKR